MDVREEIRKGKNIYELPLTVCYYARVSTDHELQATSIVNQVDYFVKYIQSNVHWKFFDGYIDEGISGKEVRKRDDFLRMIQDGKDGKFQLILTKSVSRFARNTMDSIWYTDLLLQYGVGVLFLNDNINTIYPDSEFRLTLMASIAQDELRKLSESVRFGLKQSIDRGVVLGNSNILGYVKEKGKLVIDPKEALIVREIYDLFVTGKYRYSEIGILVDEKYGKKLDSTGVKRILTNCKYKGYYCGRKSMVIDYKSSKRKWFAPNDWIQYADYEKVPPIVEEKVWDKVQVMIQDRSRNKISRNYHEGERYQGKIICVVHHKPFRYQIKKYKEHYYGYFCCHHCCTLSQKLLDRIYQICPFVGMKVIPRMEDLELKIRCQ